jgi:hypothetical protein
MEEKSVKMSERLEVLKILTELVKVWQEGKVKPNTSSNNSSSTIVRDAKEASKYIDAANKKISELLNLEVNE